MSRQFLAVVLALTTFAYAEGNSWDRVRYNGGTLQTKVDPKDWDNHLTVTSDLITFKLKDGQTIEIPTKSVTQLSYGQEAHRRVGTMVALGILVAPLALFGLFHKTRLHFIGIEYTTAEQKKAGLLLQGDKGNYRAILMALKGATGVAVVVSEKDREYVPTGVATTVVKEPEQQQGEQKPSAATATPAAGTGSSTTAKSSAELEISSTPAGADIEIDGNFVGSTPSTVGVGAGDHLVVLKKKGFRPWERKLTASTGHVSINAELEAEAK